MRKAVIAALLHAALAAGSAARAAEPRGSVDTTYGRIEGDMAVAVGAGATLASRGPRGEVDLRLRYLDTAGVFATYEEGPLFGSGAEPRRVFAGGLELRPLFLGRWLNGWELGVDRLDLAIDSLGVEIGAVLEQPSGGAFASRPGLEVGLGLELPIGTRANGPWIGLHGGVRWADSALEGRPIADASDRALYLSITLAFHQVFGAHVVDVGDTAPR